MRCSPLSDTLASNQSNELHKIRRQDLALSKDADERARIKQYRNAVESAAGGQVE